MKKPNAVAPEAAEARISDEASLVALRARTGQEVFHLHGALRVTDQLSLELAPQSGMPPMISAMQIEAVLQE